MQYEFDEIDVVFQDEDGLLAVKGICLPPIRPEDIFETDIIKFVNSEWERRYGAQRIGKWLQCRTNMSLAWAVLQEYGLMLRQQWMAYPSACETGEAGKTLGGDLEPPFLNFRR